MSPIIGIQRRLAEVGRIRIGEQVPMTTRGGKAATRPKRLETFRITSSNHKALAALAEVYGGSVVPWEDAPVGNQFELYTKADELSVIVPPEAMSFSQFFEVWSGGGCQVRCDGNRDSINETPCHCDPEERKCKPHTRLSVMIAEVATSGMWRLDTQGYYAASELGGAFDLAMLMTEATGRSVLRASLRLDQREVKRPDEPTRQFVVPVLTFDLEAAALGTAALTGGLTPIPPGEGVGGVLGALGSVENRDAPATRKGAAEPVPSTGLRPGGHVDVDDEEDDEEDGVVWTGEQRDAIQGLLDLLAEQNEAHVERTGEDRVAIVRAWWKSSAIPALARGLTYRQADLVTTTLRDLLGVRATDAAAPDDDAGNGPQGSPDGELPKAPKPTPTKMREMFACLGDLGFDTDESQHDRVWAIVGHEGSFKDLTRAEVNKVIDQLREDKTAPPATEPEGAKLPPREFAFADESDRF